MLGLRQFSLGPLQFTFGPQDFLDTNILVSATRTPKQRGLRSGVIWAQEFEGNIGEVIGLL